MKDHFNDFEELKVLTPVREEASHLFVHILSSTDSDDTASVLHHLPLLLKTLEESAHENWITRYNFFLLVKGWFSCGRLQQ